MADNPQNSGPYYCWANLADERKLSDLQEQVYDLLAKSYGQWLLLDDIYNGLFSTKKSNEWRGWVRLALDNLVKLRLASPSAVNTVPPTAGAVAARVEPECQGADLGHPIPRFILEFLQTKCEFPPKGICRTGWCKFDDISDAVRNQFGSFVTDENCRMFLGTLCGTRGRTGRPCAERNPKNSDQYRPL